jgi:hypothetical protein
MNKLFANRDLLPTVTRIIHVGEVWSAHFVDFSLLTHAGRQYIAFFNQERQLTVGERWLADQSFNLTVLDQTLNWDSHNYLALTADRDGFLHLAGNMHASPLTYFRSERPHDASAFHRIPAMTGHDEARVTYPRFFHGLQDRLLFFYRDGLSGNGREIVNQYDPATFSWHRLHKEPMVDGEGLRSAYLSELELGADGYFHQAWIWRDTHHAETSHSPCYARSRDLVNWESADGRRLQLPLRFSPDTLIDDVGPKGGAINNNLKIGFDGAGRPIVSYHKFDAHGHTQIYNARLEDQRWMIRQTTNWSSRWEFGGGGTIPFLIHVYPVQIDRQGNLYQWFQNELENEHEAWLLDPGSFARTQRLPATSDILNAVLGADRPPRPGMRWHMLDDQKSNRCTESTYVAKWETLPENRDRPRDGPPPAPSQLEVYELSWNPA